MAHRWYHYASYVLPADHSSHDGRYACRLETDSNQRRPRESNADSVQMPEEIDNAINQEILSYSYFMYGNCIHLLGFNLMPLSTVG